MRLRDPGRPRHRERRVGRSGLVQRRLHRDHHLVVVAVVAALDLDDLVPAGGALGDPDGVHRRLGAGVGEPPHRQPVAVPQQLGDVGVELARRDVEGAVVELGLRRRPARSGSCGRRRGRRSPCRSRRRRCRRRRPSAIRRRGGRRSGAGRRPGSSTARRAGAPGGRGRWPPASRRCARRSWPAHARVMAVARSTRPRASGPGSTATPSRRMGGGHRLSLPLRVRSSRPGTVTTGDLGPLRADRRHRGVAMGRRPWQTVASHGGRSSARLERQVVALEAGGSSPLAHPNPDRWCPGRPCVPYTARPLLGADAPLAQRQSSGLLIHWFWVRIPGGAPRSVCSGPSDTPEHLSGSGQGSYGVLRPGNSPRGRSHGVRKS